MNPSSIDKQIRAAIKAEDPVALELIWEHYTPDLSAFLLGMLCSCHDAEDVLQQVFVKLVRLRGRLIEVKNLRAYLYQITRNEAIDLIKKRSEHKSINFENDDWLIPGQDTRKSEDEVMQLTKMLGGLPREQRLVILLKIYRRKTFKEIAEIMDLSQNTIASRYRYGIERLRTLLRECQQ